MKPPRSTLGRLLRWSALLSAALVAVLLLALRLAPPPPGLDRPKSQIVLDREGGWLRVQVTPDGGGMVRIPIEREELPETLVDAVLTFEDRRFYLHPGVDPLALLRAAWLNVTQGRVVSGGSTITMQVARMLKRRPRSLRSKLIEAFRALQLELIFDKEEILALYFNLAPYGGNLEGVGSASYYYYGKPVSLLALDEVATLAALPNSPSLLDPRKYKDRLKNRRNDVLERLAAAGKIPTEDAELARSMPVHAERRPPPLLAPHLAHRLHRERAGELRVRSTIDRALQQQIEKLLADHLSRLEGHGIYNGAVVLIDNETRKVRAYAGSKAFFDTRSQGQVDGADALRSPGSTLKPFVYAQALDRGLIGVNTLLEDVPIHYRDWSPGNFDGKHRGLVPARTALAQSLNIPAVKLAERLEPDGLLALLGRAGFRSFRDGPGKYGLATVLGGTDVSLLELTNLYATLARGGEHQPYALVEDSEPQQKPVRLFSEGAAHLVTEILSDVRRPELPDAWRDAISIPQLAWKTGTSYGRRDAWSIGYTRRWSIGTWVGNFNGTGVPELVGAQAAAPLLFAIAQVLPGASTDPWFERPDDVITREVCALSGAPASPSCPHRQGESALSGVAPRARCALHATLEIDDETGHRLCARCRQGRDHHREVHVIWPAAVAAYLPASGYPMQPVPVHDPRCEHGLAGDGPVIRAPLDGDSFIVRDGVPLEHQQIALIASVEGASGKLYWFVDDALHASVEPGAPAMLDPKPGQHRVVAMDAEGRKAAITITVR